MRISDLLLTTALLAMFGSFSTAVYAADAIKVSSIAQVETEAVGKDGKKTLKLSPVTRAVPGTEVVYTTTFQNFIKKPVGNITIDNPIPNASEYKAGSAFGKDCDIQFSVDGGKTFGHAEELTLKGADGKTRPALAKEYTNIRWVYKKQLAPGKSGEVGFRAAIK